jgi:Protein of unknown function (DUF2442)
MNYILKSVTPLTYPVLHLVFADGFEGDYDLTKTIARGEIFEPLKDRSLFETVKMESDGYAFGWRLDATGREIDFSAEGARIDIENALADQAAQKFKTKIQAAE